jgi:hypothetical protein
MTKESNDRWCNNDLQETGEGQDPVATVVLDDRDVPLGGYGEPKAR